MATTYGPGSLNISWSLAFMEGVAVQFTLTATNLNVLEVGSPIVVAGIRDRHYVLSHSDSTSDRFRVEVVASNLAGSSAPSEILVSFHSLNNVNN